MPGRRRVTERIDELPRFLDKDVDAAVLYRNGHIWLGWLLFAIRALHVGAALWHHFVKRDATLAQMLPWAAKRGR